MKNLFLTSSFADSYQFLETFTQDSINGKKVIFIDIASQVEENSDYIEEGIQRLETLGAIVTRLNKDITDYEAVIHETDYIYVAGGNTFYLLQELKKTGLDKLIIQHIEAGKLYIGESAGSIIMAKDISYIKHMDDISMAPELADYTGLNQIDISPVPHLENEYLDEAVQTILVTEKEVCQLTPFRDNEVLTYKNNKLKKLS